MYDIILQNLLSPSVLFFALGFIASVTKSDLKFPSGLSESLSLYLLIAIGFKGGIELSDQSVQNLIGPMAGTLFLGVVIPLFALILGRWIRLDLHNSIALAATYGSVSIVTFGAAIAFLNNAGIKYESFMNAMVVLLESPAILVSLVLYGILQNVKSVSLGYAGTHERTTQTSLFGIKWMDRNVLRESLLGKSVLLMLGSLFIGLIVGQRALPIVKPLFFDLYQSILVLFLLNMGLLAGQRVTELGEHGLKLVSLGIVMPILFGTLGVWVGKMSGLSLGGMTVMGVMAGSASYIAAPAALRTSVPEANPSIYLGLSLGVTFPFNLVAGIPLYYHIAQWIG
ncbi:sodium-dependent bicarbonate transport family permease [Effusibacillus pohliae]|uniref:sodium-dependent bicarbonate transport family permease n=1 Tax=Effusibacillus pohliae TaxID=232270 RepID=UPI00037C54F0|nr:sodium-dependent bicarbonate transport family permease [Effusibacillus pohliae]